MKRRSINSTHYMLSEDEIEVAGILMELPHLVTKSRILQSWGAKRRRSGKPPLSPSPPVSSPYDTGHEGPALEPEITAAEVEASSPATPLSYSPSQSDESESLKRKGCDEKLSLGIRTEKPSLEASECLNAETKMRQTQAAFKCSVILENKDHRHLHLHLHNHHVRGPSIPIYHQPSIMDRTAIKAETSENSLYPHIQTRSFFQSTSSFRLGMISKDVGQLVIPDLNVPLEECFWMDSTYYVDKRSQSRAMAAQARQKRMQICRDKNSNGANKSRFS